MKLEHSNTIHKNIFEYISQPDNNKMSKMTQIDGEIYHDNGLEESI